MEWPKRARTADWENGVLTLDGEKKFDIPELTTEIMERLAGYTLVGFHVKGYPVTDEMLIPFTAHKNMVNFGVENGSLTDACFPVFSAMSKLRILLHSKIHSIQFGNKYSLLIRIRRLFYRNNI